MANIIAALLLICAVSVARGDFVSDVNNILDKATMNLNIWECVEKARRKGNGFNGNSEMKVAVSMVNLYTQNCSMNAGLFYSVLNNRLSLGVSNDNGFNYLNFGNLLNVALNILQEKYGVKGVDVYRGQCDINIAPGTTYRPKRFFSTSNNPNKAFKATCFMVIKNAIGVSIEELSAFPREHEVLIRYTAEYKVENKTSNTSKMNAVLGPLGVSRAHAYTTVMVLRQQTICPSRRRRSTSTYSCDSAVMKPFNLLYILSIASLLKSHG